MASAAAGSDQEEASEGKQYLRERLAAAVRSIGWSYAIFWSISSRQPGVLTWNDGYYNGEIKTRKVTMNSTDVQADQEGAQRSEQLRELYESLLSGDGNPQQMRRPSASLSPEDLTDTEWYYLVCMSFTFGRGRGLPGRSFASSENKWLCNAQLADSRNFARSLLAKTASIQTVVCIPFMSGVLELGTTDMIEEDLALVKRIRISFSEQFISSPSVIEREGRIASENPDCTVISGFGFEPNNTSNTEQIKDTTEEFGSIYEELDMDFSEDCSEGRCSVPPSPKGDRTRSPVLDAAQESLDGSPVPVSSFTVWHRGPRAPPRSQTHPGAPQKLLKTVLKGDHLIRPEENGSDTCSNHVMSERRRREKLNEKFLILRSLVPSIHKVDKASILARTIAYLKELEQRVEELESCRGQSDRETRGRRRRRDIRITERTSDTYCHRRPLNKRKASQVGNAGVVHRWVFSQDGPIDVDVTMIDREVCLEVHCQWREFLVPRVFEAIRSLHLDPLSVQSSTDDGRLALTVRAKFVSSAVAAPGSIKQALQRAVGKC